MLVETLATLTGDGSTDVEINTAGYEKHPEGVLQIDITGTITVQVLGSLDDTAYVEILAAGAADQLSAIALVPFLRFTVTGSSGTPSAVVKLGRNGPRP